jgi:RNA 3'-terminal phosphate cyclase (ATP)
MALARGGIFRTLSPTQHTTTNAEIVKKFIDVDIAINAYDQNIWEIELWNG